MAIIATGQSYNMSIGERVELSVAVTQSSALLTDFQWELPMQHILETYIGPDNSFRLGAKVPLAERDLKNSAVSFNWADDGEYKIMVHYKMDGAAKTDDITFKVHRPQVLQFAGGTSGAASTVVADGDRCGLRGPLSRPSAARGFVWGATVQRGSAYRGRIGYIQLVNTVRLRPPRPNIISGDYVLDGAAGKNYIFYGNWQGTKALNDRAVTLATHDLPGANLGDAVTASFHDKFKTYLMYQSERPLSIWAPLGRLKWEWNAVFKRNTITDPWSVEGTPSATVGAVGTFPINEFPEWTRYIPDLVRR